MNRHILATVCPLILLAVTCPPLVHGQKTNRPYRLESVDLKQRVIWGAECRLPDGTGLAFGGQDQDAADGRPHTRVLKDGKWVAIHEELRKAHIVLGHSYENQLLQDMKLVAGRLRYAYFQNFGQDQNKYEVQINRYWNEFNKLRSLFDDVNSIYTSRFAIDGGYDFKDFVSRSYNHFNKAKAQLPKFTNGFSATSIKAMYAAQIELEIAAAMYAFEPPARAMNCGKPRREKDNSPPSQTIVHDKKTGLYLIFGGDHLDYLTNDTWVFDPKGPRWELRHPKGAPPPRANHRLEANGDGTVTLTGGYTYANNTDYLGGQYVDLNDGKWTYNIEKNEWTGGNESKLVAPESRTYRKGPFHPDYYLQGDKPDAAKFQAWLKEIPENKWVATNPPYRPRLNRDWGTARIDPSRDIILRWSGGHSAHGGTDVPHFHFATNRWELAFPVEFPLGQLYSNTSYPNGFNFNRRPWMTGHTYQNYAFDPPSKMMIKAGRPKHFYVYDPDLGDWVGRGQKPKAMQYNSCFYTLTLTATPHGIVCWDKYGRVHRYSHKGNDGGGPWLEIKTTGDKLPGAYVDNSTIVYDSNRNRVLMFNTPGYGKQYSGEVFALDLKTSTVTKHVPSNSAMGKRFATIDKSCYDATNDIVLIGTYLKNEDGSATGHTATPAFDCKSNQWITLDIGYELGERYNRVVRHFPHTRSDGLMYDAKRKLIWGTDTNSQVYVLRLKR